MRKIIVLSMITLDGVMQAPGGPEEDTSGGFQYGGWVAPYGDEVSGKVMQGLMKPADLLLGGKTFRIWEGYWPQHESAWPGINDVTKYVLSGTMKNSAWKNTVFFNSLADIEKLKASNGAGIQVWGSGELVQLLLANDLVDELWLMIHPPDAWQGKKIVCRRPDSGCLYIGGKYGDTERSDYCSLPASRKSGDGHRWILRRNKIKNCRKLSHDCTAGFLGYRLNHPLQKGSAISPNTSGRKSTDR